MCNDEDGGVRKGDGYGKKELEELAIKREREKIVGKESELLLAVCASLSNFFQAF